MFQTNFTKKGFLSNLSRLKKHRYATKAFIARWLPSLKLDMDKNNQSLAGAKYNKNCTLQLNCVCVDDTKNMGKNIKDKNEIAK